MGNILSFLSARLWPMGNTTVRMLKFKQISKQGGREGEGGDSREKISNRKNDKGLVNYAL